MLIKFALTLTLICSELTLSNADPSVKRNNSTVNTSLANDHSSILSRLGLISNRYSFCKRLMSGPKHPIIPANFRFERRGKSVDSINRAIDTLKSRAVQPSRWKNNPKKMFQKPYTIRPNQNKYQRKSLTLPNRAIYRVRQSGIHTIGQNRTDKLERRNPAILLNPVLLPLRILLAIYRILTAPLRILLAPVFLLLRALLRLLILLVQLLNPLFYLTLVFQGGQFAFNIARMILMILRRIFRRRRRHHKDEREEIEVITLVEEHPRPVEIVHVKKKKKKKHNDVHRRSIEESNNTLERVGDKLRSMVQSLKHYRAETPGGVFKRYKTETRSNHRQYDFGMVALGNAIGLNNANEHNQWSRFETVLICDLLNPGSVGNRFANYQLNKDVMLQTSCLI